MQQTTPVLGVVKLKDKAIYTENRYTLLNIAGIITRNSKNSLAQNF